ncbi:MAG: hypothetical protein QM687_00820 [Ferruginibacter sp.]
MEKKFFKLSGISLFLIPCVLFSLLLQSCKKEYKTNVPSEGNAIAEFAPVDDEYTVNYYVNPDSDPYLLPVGFDGFSKSDRTIEFSVTSRTATLGTHFEMPTSITIPAGKVLDTLRIKGHYDKYVGTSRLDTVVIKITNHAAVNQMDSFRLIIQPFCDETDIVAAQVSALAGTYANTNETFNGSPYGPYTTAVSNVTLLTATTARITVENIWDNGWGPVQFTLDWTNSSGATSKSVTAISQAGVPGSNAGDLNSTYAGYNIAVRQFSGNPGYFTVCSQQIVLRMQLGVGVTGGSVLGYFAPLYQVTMKR